ncbi:WYL domain-containing transcriptional regulator [Mitsuokella jalaludinii]|mgnify:FL=1|uniref:helix-turn-helix transcriptional regulator n=1 Tax=Mitsuokella jalaludinii TaxID=187979 RepID=UPI002FDA97D7
MIETGQLLEGDDGIAGRKRRGWNKYIADYDKLRMFLRYISYGCYHKQYLARQLGQSARSYEDNWARVRSFLPEDRLQAVRQGHREIHSLKGDSYHSAFNDLARTYAIKSLKSSSAFALLCLLQVFSGKAVHFGREDRLTDAAGMTGACGAADDGRDFLDEKTLLQYELVPTDRAFPKRVEDISRSTLHRYLCDLTDQGLLERREESGRYGYRLAPDILGGLREDEASALLAAIAFYRNVSLLGMPGYFLEQSLRARYPAAPYGEVPCQFKHMTITRILDDDVLYALACCIAEYRAVRFRYRGKGVVAIPLRLITDFESGRQYLLAIRKRRTVSKRFTIAQSYRIDFMQEVQPAHTIKNQPDVTLPERHILRLAFRYDDERGRDHLIYRIREHEPKAVIRDDSLGTLHVTFETVDDLKLMPWLRTFYPTVRVEKDGPAHLAERMKIDIEEALKHYGIRPALP